MNLAMAYHSGDREQAIRWLKWVKELGGIGRHKLFLMPSFDCEPIPEILPFIAVKDEECVKEPYGQRQWSDTEPMRSASAPNSMFRQFAWKFYLEKLGHWMFIEPDCIPLVSDWHDRLDDEYKQCGKPFLGAHVLIESIPEHLTGNSIYPQNVPEEAPTLVMRTEWVPRGQEQAFELAFDIAGAAETVPKAHWTKLIQHKFRYEGFKSRKQFDEVIDPDAVVFHSDKSGSIFPYLRENLGGGVESRNAKSDDATLLSPSVRPTDSESSASPAQNFASPELRKEIEQELPNIPETWTSPILRDNENLEPPWKNRAESEREVRLLCSALALFCKAPAYKSRVRNALREAKIIK